MNRSLSLLAWALLPAFAAAQSLSSGAVYTSTNDAKGNQVAIYTRAADGTVTFDQFVATGGTGTGTTLGNQGAVLLSEDERFLFVVNAGSNSISSFLVGENGITLVGTVSSKGKQPISLTQHDDLLYVVNDVSDDIAGFEIGDDGALKYVNGSKKNLSGNGTDPAQIGFTPDGLTLIVTEKATDRIDRFQVKGNGKPSNAKVTQSAGPTPFGFAFGLRGQIFVSQAADNQAGLGSASSYEVASSGQLTAITSSLGTTQTASCWVAATPDRRLLYVTNTDSDTVSLLAADFDGALTLGDADAVASVDAPTDVAVSRDARFLYVLVTGTGEIGDFTIAPGGALTPIAGSNTSLPAGATGLAVR